MKGREILEALSFIEERHVEEAERGRFHQASWMRFAAMAACFCVLVGAACMIRIEQQPMEGETNGIPEMMPENLTEAMEAAEGGLDSSAAGASIPLVLTVDQRTEKGFRGTVVNTVGELEAGTEVVVCPGAGAQWSLPDESTQVYIREYFYDSQENVVYAAWIGKDD